MSCQREIEEACLFIWPEAIKFYRDVGIDKINDHVLIFVLAFYQLFERSKKFVFLFIEIRPCDLLTSGCLSSVGKQDDI